MRHSPSLYFRSAVCTAFFKARRIPCSLVTCEGPFPRVYNRGNITIEGRLGFGGQLVPVELGTATPSAYLHVGDGVYLNNGATVVAYCGIEIGGNSFIGDFVAIYDTNHHSMDGAHPARSAPVVIGTNVWLGRHVTVLPGSKIGDHTVVSAGSVVRGDLPPRVLAVGNPATPVKDLEIPDGWRRT